MSSPTRMSGGRALRFARLSKVMSWLAGLAIAGVIGLFLVQAGLFSLLVHHEVPPPAPVTNPDQITAEGSTVTGLDRENQPYEVKAGRGWQDEATPTLVHLETIEGRFRRSTGVEYTLEAAAGLYDTKAKSLDLAGNVVIVQKDRFTARMDKAHVMVEEKKLTSDSPVDVTMTTGSVRVNGIAITENGSKILFLNGVKAEFNVAPAKGVAKP